jgi:transcription initiation factor IIE alpha subunit
MASKEARLYMRNRAERLAAYLETGLGWEVYNNESSCPKCLMTDFGGAAFCKRCGSKMVIEKNDEVIKDLMRALDYADGKTRKISE